MLIRYSHRFLVMKIEEIFENHAPGFNPAIIVTIPIIVTTAPINIFNYNLTLEDIKKENDITHLFRTVPGVVFNRNEYKDEKKILESLILSGELKFSDSLLNWFRSNSEFEKNIYLSMKNGMIKSVYIINYYYLEKCFAEIVNRIENICKSIDKGLVIKT